MASEILASGRTLSAAATTQPVTPVRQTVNLATATATTAAVSATRDSVTLSHTATRLNHLELSVGHDRDDGLTPEREAVTRPQPKLAQLRAAFLTSTSDKGFDAGVDFNSDGRITFADLAALKASQQGSPAGATPVTGEPPQPASLDDVRNGFLSSTGDDNFNAAADLNGDGTINFADLAALKASQQSAGPVDDTQEQPATLDDVRNGFLSSTGDDNFNAAADLNGDGTINFADLAALKASQQSAGPVDDTQEQPATLDDVRNGFLSSDGDDNFNAAADFNGDGTINFADLAALKASQEPAVEDATPTAAPLNATLSGIRESFLERVGSAGFNLSADLNADGIVNFGDLAALRARAASGDTLNASLVSNIESPISAGSLQDRIARLTDSYSVDGNEFADLEALLARLDD